MTIRDMRQLIKSLPSSMIVVVKNDDGKYEEPCASSVDIVQAMVCGELKSVFSIGVCRCVEIKEKVVVDVKSLKLN